MITQIKQQVTTQQFVFIIAIAGLSCLITGLILLGNSYTDRLFPNTYINSINVSGLSLSNSITVLENHKEDLEPHELVLTLDDISLASNSADLGYTTDFTQAVEEVYTEQHKNHPIVTTIKALASFFQNHEITAPKKYDSEKLQEFLTAFNQKVETIGINPSAELKVSGSTNSIVVFPGKSGRELETEKTRQTILEELQKESHEVKAHIASTSSVLSQQDIELTIKRAEKFVDKKVTITAEDKKFFLSDKDLITMIDPVNQYQREKITDLVTDWTQKVNRPSQDAVFEFDAQTLEVKEFVPHKDGLEVDTSTSVDLIITWLNDVESSDEQQEIPSSILLALKKTKPEIPLEKTNDLGINERIGFGESYYHHSIPNRIHNVGITAQKISHTIIPPGVEFSFNKTLGNVSSATGFRSAYVISGGRTILGDGGGVCQVSSTLFRSVLDAGLDITKRLQHSYRVSYYELNSQPGFDATVYSGEVDFRFKNDTPGHIILVSYNDPTELYMNIEIYGTDDGRVSEISNYKQWGFVSAPAAEYYPTPDLPSGVKQQIDWSVSGIKAEFTHTVKDKDGNIIHNDTYYSNYRPWSAKYMVGI